MNSYAPYLYFTLTIVGLDLLVNSMEIYRGTYRLDDPWQFGLALAFGWASIYYEQKEGK